MACRAGGVDPVPNLADRLTEPADLARSPFFEYRFTLGGGTRDERWEMGARSVEYEVRSRRY
jgi:hypothetical protein